MILPLFLAQVPIPASQSFVKVGDVVSTLPDYPGDPAANPYEDGGGEVEYQFSNAGDDAAEFNLKHHTFVSSPSETRPFYGGDSGSVTYTTSYKVTFTKYVYGISSNAFPPTDSVSVSVTVSPN